MTDLTRLDRAIADAVRSFGDLMDAFRAELELAKATVAPHQHPAEKSRSIIDLHLEPGDGVQPLVAKSISDKGRLVAVWTPDRLAVLKRDYIAGVAIDTILEHLNALPAVLPVKRHAVGITAAKHGWRRPVAPTVTVRPDVVPPPAAIPGRLLETVKVTVAPPPEPAPRKSDIVDIVATVSFGHAAEAKPVEKPIAVRWTEARIDAARPLYEAGASVADIVVTVNRLPGAAITMNHVTHVAASRGWKRGSPGKPAIVAAAIEADFDEIRHWAGNRGIMVEGRTLPLDAINSRRAHLGQPPFVLKPTYHRHVA